MHVPAKVRGLSDYYQNGLERLEIWIDKHVAEPLPYQENKRVDVDLIVGGHQYRAGLRSTPKNEYVWISPDLDEGTPKLAEVLQAAGFTKNQAVVLEVAGTRICLLPVDLVTATGTSGELSPQGTQIGTHTPAAHPRDPSTALHPTGYWTFFCNPAKWAIDRFLASNREYDDYTITDWQAEWFTPGQLGVVRVGTDRRTKAELADRQRLRPGIYAIVQVLSTARVRETRDDQYWLIDPPVPGARLVVDIKYLRNLLISPLLFDQLAGDPLITDRYLLRGFQAPTIPLDPASFERILGLSGAEDQVAGSIEIGHANSGDDIAALEAKYANATPLVREIVSRRIERGPVGDSIKRLSGYKCMICDGLGQATIAFLKKDGLPYVEAHHVLPVASRQLGALRPSNVISVCAHHHRQLHYGNAEVVENRANEFVFRIDGATVQVPKIEYPE